MIIQLDENNAFKEKSIKFAILGYITDHVIETQKYLQNSLDASIFLQGMDCNDDTALIMTSREKSSAMVSAS